MKGITQNNLPRVAIVGRPNVGKSTLFNRIAGSRKAIVDSVAGSTRDRNVEVTSWGGKSFEIIDTGGIFEEADTPIDEQVAAHVLMAIEEADLICWVVDARAGLVPEDQFLSGKLREQKDRVFLAVNKIDTGSQESDAMEFHRLGFDRLFPISAEHGLGVAELLDVIVEALPQAGSDEARAESRVAIVGRPNVGKSSLLNRLAGEERAVVTEVAGTTRDAVDTWIELDGETYRFVDTAGIRRRGKLPTQADRVGVLYSERAIQRAHLCLLVLDAMEGVKREDASIGGKVADAGRGAILVFNKWDLEDSREERAAELRLEAREKIPHLDFAPIVFVSALSGRGVSGVAPRIRRVREQQQIRIPTPELNRFLEQAVARFPPRARDGKEARLLYATQVGVTPPRFVVFSNRAKNDLDATYPRYLRRRLREEFGFEGSPVRVAIRKRSESRSGNDNA